MWHRFYTIQIGQRRLTTHMVKKAKIYGNKTVKINNIIVNVDYRLDEKSDLRNRITALPCYEGG